MSRKVVSKEPGAVHTVISSMSVKAFSHKTCEVTRVKMSGLPTWCFLSEFVLIGPPWRTMTYDDV